jgi:hypothetical protein
VIVGNTKFEYSLEIFLLRAAKRLGYEAIGLPLHGGRIMLTPKVPDGARRRLWRRPLAVLCRELEKVPSTPDDILLLVRCAPLLNDIDHLNRLLESWVGRVVLVAPDRLSTFCGPMALRVLIESGATISTYDTQAELAEHGEWLSPRLLGYDFGYDVEAHWHPVEDAAQTIDEIVFVGTWDIEREGLVSDLGRHYPVAVYGAYWNRSRKHPGVRVVSGHGLFGQSQAAVITKYAVTLNIPRAQNLRKGNMRTFEIPAQGGFQANAYGAKILRNGIWAGEAEDLTQQIDVWLTAPRPKRLEALRAAQAEVRPYSYETRLRDLTDALARTN